MKDIVLSLQLLDLIFIAQLSLHENRFALLFLVGYNSHFFLELSQHFLIILPLFGQFLTMSIIHILKYFLELINFKDSFIFFKKDILYFLFILIDNVPHIVIFSGIVVHFGLVCLAHFQSLLEIWFYFLVLSF